MVKYSNTCIRGMCGKMRNSACCDTRGQPFGIRAKSWGERLFAGHIIDKIYIFYLCIINDNTVSSALPLLGQ
jgi:hypothetical protein